jgi:8-oxo-dGTP diphosphatase
MKYRGQYAKNLLRNMNPFIDHTEITYREDKYGGIIIDDSTVTQPLEEFEKSLIKIISDLAGKTLIWITLPIGKSNYIAVLTKHGFTFYDCNENSLILLKKLTLSPVTPTATNHTIGVGAFVRDGDNMLVVKDRVYRKYKLPLTMRKIFRRLLQERCPKKPE